MTEALIFGSPQPNVRHAPRRAAYVIIIVDEMVALVKDQRKKLFLPGGGSLTGEAPEATILREVNEELGRGVRLIRRLGEAVQYFYSSTDERHYRMLATFFAGEFTDKPETGAGGGEHELHWLPLSEAEQSCFHACHAWAVQHARGLVGR